MKKILSIVPALIIFLSLPVFSQTGNAEFRATWVITWEHISGSSDAETNKARVRKILDNHQKANMNAVLWQVRQSGTAYYNSIYEPWGYYAGGSDPGYDPLAYAIEEAHKRGLELHAWFNAFHTSSTRPGTPVATHPEWVCTNIDGDFMTKQQCLSPGLDSVRNYTLDVAMEIVNNYDIDGLHFDFVRWNEYDEDDMKSQNLPLDINEYGEYKAIDGIISEEKLARLNLKGTKRYIYDSEHPASGGIPEGFDSWADWRRWSVTEFVRTVHDSIQQVKPWVRLSAAALGKYRWSGWQGYGTVYQDAALWFNEGYVDQLTPMHYHWTTASGFLDMLAAGDPESWDYYIQPGIDAGRLFSVGPASYILLDNKIWYRHKEIINACREISWVDGFQFFSYGSWNGAQYWDEAGQTVFSNKTKIRNMVQTAAPGEPTVTLLRNDSLKYEITVTPDAGISNNHWFIVYRSEDETVDPETDEIIDIHFGQETYTVTDSFPGTQNFNGKYHYAATCLDRFWGESPISNPVVSDSIPSYAPVVLSSTPVNESTVPVNTPIEFIFSKSIDTTGFSGKITINPAIPLSGFKWTDDNQSVKFLTSGSLAFDIQYTITLHATISDVNGIQLDGNADGVPGDSYTITFMTYDVDVSGPVMIASYPDMNTEKFDLDDVITIEFDEQVNLETINKNTISLINAGNPVTIEAVVNTFENRSILNVKPYSQLISDAVNLLTLSTGITDTLGNALSDNIYIDFTTDNYYYSAKKMVDDFSGDGNWWKPTSSGGWVGVVAGGSEFGHTAENYLPASEFNDADKKSGYLKYQWDENSTEFLLREHVGTSPTTSINIDTSWILQVYVYGDGSNNQFRFSLYEAGAQVAEVSKWITIDWVGWKLVEWDLGDPNSIGEWIGNGIMDGTSYRMEGFHMTKPENGAWSGRLYFDNLRLVKRTAGQAPPNSPPVLADLPDTSVTAGKYIKIYPTWTDPDAADVHQIICQSDTSGVYFYIKGHTSGSTVYVRTLEEYAGTSLVTIIVKDYGIGELSDTTSFILTVLSSNDIVTQNVPNKFSLEQNYPNPFNPTTTIRFSLDRGGHTRLIIYDLLGRKITEILNRHLNIGSYEIVFDASNLASGQYIYQLISGQKVITKKMMLLK